MGDFPPLSLRNYDGKFSIPCKDGSLLFDSVDGVGAAPNNANVRYMGIGVIMRPSRFLDLTLPLHDPRPRSMEHFAKPDTVMCPPTLYINMEGRNPRVTGHEGRHRATSILRRCGDARVLVHLFPIELRARHMDFGRLMQLRAGIVAEGTKVAYGDNFNVAIVGERAVNMPEPDPLDLIETKVRQVAEKGKIYVHSPGWERRVAGEIKNLTPAEVTPESVAAACDKLKIYYSRR
jgi:hypothetical protein